jgi:lysophospholipase L1-like esterase
MSLGEFLLNAEIAGLLDNTVARGGANRVAGSIMFITDSIGTPGTRNPLIPADGITRPGYFSDSTMTVNGAAFLSIEVEFGSFPASGSINGFVKFYAEGPFLSWTDHTGVEGPKVLFLSTGAYYLPGTTPTSGCYVLGNFHMRPGADATGTIPVYPGALVLSNAGVEGFAGWLLTMLGPVVRKSICYSLPGSRATEWAKSIGSQFTEPTDMTVIELGTNDALLPAAEVIEALRKLAMFRLSVCPRVALTALLPSEAASAAAAYNRIVINQGIRRLAFDLGCEVIDGNPYLADGKVPNKFIANVALDGLHPSGYGHYRQTKYQSLGAVRKHFPANYVAPSPLTRFNAVSAPGGNHLSMPFAGALTTGLEPGCSGSVPAGVTSIRNTGATITCVSIAPDDANAIPRTDGVQGNWYRSTLNNPSSTDSQSWRVRGAAFITTFTPGKRYVLEGDLRLSSAVGLHYFTVTYGLNGNGQNITAYAIHADGSASSTLANLDGDTVTIPFKSKPFRIPVAAVGGLAPTQMNWGVVAGLKPLGSVALDMGMLNFREATEED